MHLNNNVDSSKYTRGKEISKSSCKKEQNMSRNKMLHSLQGNVLVRHILELSKLFWKAGWVFILSTSGNIYGVLEFFECSLITIPGIRWSYFPYFC